MKKIALLASLSLGFAGSLLSAPAHACGGCFVQESENTQVSSHRMILSLSTSETTLWDQITYDGDPSEFAWVLPIKGTVEIGLSSDALFQTLEQMTEVQVSSPQITCPQPPICDGDAFAGGAGTGGASGEDNGVTVLASEVVGPYDTKQLESSDPAALNNWLAENGYNIPADIQPIINSYVFEGYNFLALKLIPGQGIDSMRPVRITTAGASPALPLRMVAAGTGARTPISLFVFGEGRYDTANFPSFTIDPADIVWDWDSSSSNYTDLREAGFDAVNHAGWLVQAAEPLATWYLDELRNQASWDPVGSGYADENGQGAEEAVDADLEKLVGGLAQSDAWITRFYGELDRAALGKDLALGASEDQTTVTRYFEAATTIGSEPECPPVTNTCDDGGAGSGVSSGTGFYGQAPDDQRNPLGGSSSGCTVQSPEIQSSGLRRGHLAWIGAAAVALLVMRRRRRTH